MPFTPKVQKLMQHQSDDEIKDADKSDTTFSAGSLQAALRAAGSVIAAIDAVVDGTHRNAFCCVRPPGHHAGANGLESDAVSCGFCIFNNVAIGALHALREHSSAVKKVAVIDFDVHHGNGTQAILEGIDDPSAVFFFSIHLCEFARLPCITVDMSARWHGQVATRAVIADCQCPVDFCYRRLGQRLPQLPSAVCRRWQQWPRQLKAGRQWEQCSCGAATTPSA